MKNIKLILLAMVFVLLSNTNLFSQSATINIIDQPDDMIGCYNETGRVIGVVAENVNSLNELNFQWFKDGVPLQEGVGTPFATNEAGLSFGPLSFSQSGIYTCAIWDETETINEAVYSRPTTVYVITKPNITRQPMTVMANTGETVYMDVEATLYGELPPSYHTRVQWYAGNTALEDNEDFSGTDQSYITVRNAEKYYNAEIWCQLEGYCGVVNSATVTITPSPGVEITSDLTGDVEVCEGESATLTVEAQATNGGDDSNLMYQWYAGGSMLVDGADVQGAMTNTLVWNVASGTTTNIYCEVTYGNTNEMASSMMVNAIGNTAPVFTMEPADQEVDEGMDLILEAMASGENVSYTWYMESSTMSVGTGSSLTISAVTEDDGGSYYVVASGDCGDVTSSSASITVKTSGISMSVDNAEKFNFDISPNPVESNSVVRFNLPTAQNVRLVLNSATGMEIAEITNNYLPQGSNQFEINANQFNLSNGVYYLTLVTENGIATKKLLYIK